MGGEEKRKHLKYVIPVLILVLPFVLLSSCTLDRAARWAEEHPESPKAPGVLRTVGRAYGLTLRTQRAEHTYWRYLKAFRNDPGNPGRVNYREDEYRHVRFLRANTSEDLVRQEVLNDEGEPVPFSPQDQLDRYRDFLLLYGHLVDDEDVQTARRRYEYYGGVRQYGSL